MRQCRCIFHLIHTADVCSDDGAYPALSYVYIQYETKTNAAGNHRYEPNLDTAMDYCNESLKV